MFWENPWFCQTSTFPTRRWRKSQFENLDLNGFMAFFFYPTDSGVIVFFFSPADSWQRSTWWPGNTTSGGRGHVSPRSRFLSRLQELWRRTTVNKNVLHLSEQPIAAQTLLLSPSPPSPSFPTGVILSSVISPDPNVSPFLLVLDARTFKEIARASIPASVHQDLHGLFIPACQWWTTATSWFQPRGRPLLTLCGSTFNLVKLKMLF